MHCEKAVGAEGDDEVPCPDAAEGEDLSGGFGGLVVCCGRV